MFWGLEVNKSVKFQTPFDLHITTACLDASAKGTERTVVQVEYEGKTYAICSLSVNGIASATLDTNFEQGKEIAFKVSGNNTVHLTGYFVDSMLADDSDDEEDSQEESDEEINSDEIDFEEGAEDDDEDEEEEDEEDEDEQKVLAATVAAALNKRKLEINQNKEPQTKKNKIEQPAVTKAQTTAAASPAKKEQTPTKKEQTPTKVQPAAKPAASPAKKPAAVPAQSPKAEEKKGKVTLKNGLQYEDIQIGTGPTPVAGKRIAVKYIGKLQNGKTFDSSLNKPFSFRLGVGEVIKGWDLGFAGMKVGGKRRLVIPSNLGYGPQGAPPSIPGNATLIFDVELCKTT
ncbi:hypothetical protein CYY_004987 [Polysphondylium violaceum]|uniref:peptidylprolyl isomerase n=1 Tax=Polysphondylium violaceum TaxID=133409 RepID=A0A8J4PVW0_9MYCE|nr:hypothetical protein CYY_004987 [Polysphondylium violaceum]